MSSFESSERTETQQPQQPQLCSKGCGFFSNVGSNGMCSKCYRAEQQKAEGQAAPLASQPEAEEPAQPLAAPPVAPPAEPAAPSPSAPAVAALPEPTSKVSTRCEKCRKKVGLTGFKCKCGHLFCGQHRYAEAHDCDFDYKGMQREKLTAANPVIQAAKVERI